MRKVFCVLGLLLLATLPVAAQETPRLDVSVGYSYVRINPADPTITNFNSQGGSVSVAWNVNNVLGIVGDIGGYKISEIQNTQVDAKLYTFMFGPRITRRSPERFHPYGQVLFGGARATESGLTSSSESGFALALGGGADIKIAEHLSLRIVQFEYLFTRITEGPGMDNQHNFRFTTGITFHFGKK